MIKVFILFSSLIYIVGCGSNNIKNSTSSEQARANTNYTNTHAYLPHSPYAKTLESCILITDEKASCKLSKLPLLGQENHTITKEMILQRLLVSHQWMGDRFSQMLDRYSNKMILQLFGATTAIVIDDDIIPAYYWAVSGAIYLDPRYLWLTASEKATIPIKEDYRSDFGHTLQFLEATFFRKNNLSIYTSDLTNRTISQAELPLAGLLYHELAHANDFIPPSRIGSLNNDLSILENIINIKSYHITEQLYSLSPIESSNLLSLAQVLYQGASATEEQKQLSGKEVGIQFNDDVSAAMYAYSTPYEDTAMLFQSIMMKYFYNVDGYQIFFDAKAYQESNTINLDWGIQNPVLKDRVKSRAIFVTNRILPISGGWTEPIHGIAQGASLLVVSPNTHAKKLYGFDEIDPDELQFLDPSTRY